MRQGAQLAQNGRRIQRLASPRAQSAEVQLLEKVVSLVVDDDEGREVFDLDAPDRLHAELGIFEHLDAPDAVLREPCGGAADRAEIEAAVAGASLAHFARAVALGE